MENEVEIFHKIEDLSQILYVKDSTVRKYCALLAKQGYKFHVHPNGSRIFSSKDVQVLRKLIELKNQPGVSLENAVATIAKATQNEEDIEDIEVAEDIEDASDTTDVDIYKKHEVLTNEFRDFKEQQMKFQTELLKRLDKQEDYIKQSIDRRDKLLIESIRQIQESKQETAAATQISEEETKRKKKGFFTKLKGLFKDE